MLACFLMNLYIHTNAPMLVLFIHTGEVRGSINVCCCMWLFSLLSLVRKYHVVVRWSLVGTTVFCGMRKFEPSHRICPFPWNFYVFTGFCTIRYRTVIRGQIRHILMELGPLYCMYTWFHHEIHDCNSGFDGRNTENIKLSLSEILPVNLVDRLYLSVAVTGSKYCTFGRV